MKIAIWCICIILNAVITVALKYNGIILGGVPTAILFACTFGLAVLLCKKWDDWTK